MDYGLILCPKGKISLVTSPGNYIVN